jgi:hypothetical protein
LNGSAINQVDYRVFVGAAWADAFAKAGDCVN